MPSLPSVLAKLIHEDRVMALLVERLGEVDSRRTIVAAEITTHSKLDYVANYLKRPRPFLTSLLLEDLANGSSDAFLTEKQVAAANLGEGLAGIALDFATKATALETPAASFEAINALRMVTLKSHRGFNMKVCLVEGGLHLEPLITGVGFRKLHTFALSELADYGQEIPYPSVDRGVFGLFRKELDDGTLHSFAGMALIYEPPRLRFIPSEQKLIRLAAEGATDVECAEILGLSFQTIKKRWQGIYGHVLSEMPTIFGSLDERSGVRGPERRRKLLNYCLAHPEELRPHYLRRG